ncbi:MAG: hypothetical protein ACRDF7_00435 [Candidatus Limnocylindrales bacterium]
MSISRSPRRGFALLAAASLIALAAGVAQAHVLEHFGPFTVALGWVHEPTYVGAPNAVQAVVTDDQGKPITDLADGDLKVVVSLGTETSAVLDLTNAFDADTGLGTPGDYEVSLVPTAPGDYTFHLTGTIHGQSVDATATSSDSTFDSVVTSTGAEFPAKLPTVAEIATRLDRIDGRIDALPGTAAFLAGAAIGVLGVVLGGFALVIVARKRRPSGA